MTGIRVVTTTCVALAASVGLEAAELGPQTVQAFEHYVQLTEARMQTEVAGEVPFLWIDRLPERDRAEALARLRAGEVVIDRLHTRNQGEEIEIPSGMVHHWVGTVLIPGATLAETIAMVRDYDRYPTIYDPEVRAAMIRRRSGNQLDVYLQLYTKKVVTWVANTEHRVEFITVDDTRMHVPSRSIRIREIEHPDTAQEREKEEGNDRGFAWRLNNYCSFEERGDHTLMQCESITLTRSIPFLLGVIVRPFVTGVPREKLTFTLEAARRHLTGRSGKDH